MVNNWEGHWQNPRYRRISMTQATEIALQRVPGEVIKAELEYDDGILLYEIEIRNAQGVKYEVKVDAVTGEVIRVKLD
ncbi:PepSY domain-containing protein [Sporosarcina sp. FSL W8-0480]|uniref:PepSY domain-containing protein n=1 Tax=Sporosarcina sp. FSL W8-0480 TaxID=2954701 RepID=UPI0030DBF890